MRYFFEVGEYASYITNDNEVRMGVVTKVEGDVITIFFHYPEQFTMDIYSWALDPVTIDEYLGYKRYYEEKEKEETFEITNPVIEKLSNEVKSIDQLIDDILYDKEMMKALEYDLAKMLSEKPKQEPAEYIYTSPMFTLPAFKNHSEWREALKQAYIDLALDTRDWEWLKELVEND